MNANLNSIARQEKVRREIIAKGDLIPPLPDFVVRLLALLGRPETEPEDLARHLEGDPVIVARMLAMVNSPFFGLNRQITTIREAVMVLGFRGLRTLALATSTSRFMCRDYHCYGHTPKGLWEHAVTVAAITRHLSRACGLGQSKAEEMFVAGLLHDIGKMVLVKYVSDAGLDLGRDGATAEEIEAKAAGIQHAEAGALVLAKWNLDESLQDLVARHHLPAEENLSVPSAILRIADTLAHAQGIGFRDGLHRSAEISTMDLEILPLEATDFENLCTEALDLALRALAEMKTEGTGSA